jgi:hypothetical protein
MLSSRSWLLCGVDHRCSLSKPSTAPPRAWATRSSGIQVARRPSGARVGVAYGGVGVGSGPVGAPSQLAYQPGLSLTGTGGKQQRRAAV